MAFYRIGLFWAIMVFATNGVWAASSDMIIKVCNDSLYRDFCISSLSIAPGALQADLAQLSVIAVDSCIEEVKPASDFIAKLRERNPTVSALEDCTEFLQGTRGLLNKSMSELRQLSNANLMDYLSDVNIWLGGAETCLDTCLIGLRETHAHKTLVSTVKVKTDKITMLTSVALTVVNKLREQGHI